MLSRKHNKPLTHAMNYVATCLPKWKFKWPIYCCWRFRRVWTPLPLKNLSDQRIPQQNILNSQLTTSEIIHSSVSYKFSSYSFEMKLALPIAFQITGTCSRLAKSDKNVLSTNKRCKCLKTEKFIAWEWAFYWKWRETKKYNFVHRARGCDPVRSRWILKNLGRDGAEIQ